MSYFTSNQPTINKPTKARNHTFTLIEMLVVVVIIGILAGVLVPRLTGAKERASDSARIVKVSQISSAVELYAQENGTTYPLAPLTSTGTSIATPSVSTAISPYMTTIPTDPGKGTVAISWQPGNIQVTGDSFAYWTNDAWTGYAITALMESKKGNTTNSTEVIDRDKEWWYQKVGKWLTTSIVAGWGWGVTYPTTAWVHYVWNDIVVTDGTTRYIIQNKNVWATAVGTDWTNAAIRWSYFQRGNNNGFSTVGALSPASTIPVDTNWLTTYSGNTWIYGGSLPRYDWSLTQNDNLRLEKTQWPCPTWYHVPTQAEWAWLYNIRLSIYTTGANNWNLLRDTLKLPMAGLRNYGSVSSVYGQGDRGFYWSSTPDDAGAYSLGFGSSYVGARYNNNRAYGFSVRCFQNSY